MSRPTTGDLSGAVADLGIFVPLSAALVLVNGLDPGSVLFGAGMLVLAAGVVFRVPFPVQPLKAMTALAVAQGLSAGRQEAPPGRSFTPEFKAEVVPLVPKPAVPSAASPGSWT